MKKYILLFSILMIYASMVFGQGISLPSIKATAGQSVTVPINVTNFNNIGTVTINIQYDPSVLTYVDITNKPSTGVFQADANNGILSIAWYSTSGESFASKFADINFTFANGSSDLKFVGLFEVTDNNGNPIATTHSDGRVGSDIPEIKIGSVTNATAGSEVTVPVTAKKLSNVGAISLKIQYDKDALTWVKAENVYNTNITVDELDGVVTIGKYAGAAITSDSAKLCDLKFTYKNGSGDLAFLTDQCEIADNHNPPVVINVTLVNGKVSGEQATVTIGKITNAIAGSTVTVPVTATKITNVGAISLKIQYDNTALTWVKAENVYSTDINVDELNGIITIGKYAGNAITAATAKLCDLKFTYNAGSSDLSFVTADCELADPNATPISVAYTNGKVSSSLAATSLTLGSVSASTVGTAITIPVNARNLKNVGAISLKISYDKNVLTWVKAENVYSTDINVDELNGIVTIGKYAGNAITATIAKLCDLKFTYKSGTTALSFVTAECELSDPNATVLPVTYSNGAVTAGNQSEIKIGSKESVQNAAVVVPVTFTNLSGVGAISLKINYDANVLTYTGSQNAYNTDVTVDGSNPGVVTIGKYAGKGITAASGKLADLKFTYKSGNSALTFVTADCEISDTNATVIAVTLTNGNVIAVSGTSAKVSLPTLYLKSDKVGKDITVPLNVENFTKIGSISLKVEYDPSVLTYKSSLNKVNSAISVDDAAGVLSIGWYGTSPINVASGKLLDLQFNYKGETSALNFDASQSDVADSSGTSLYVEYVNGKVSANSAPSITAKLGDITNAPSGVKIEGTYKADDADGQTVTFFMDKSSPEGAVVTADGKFSWTPTQKQEKQEFTVKVGATDGVDTVFATTQVKVTVDVIPGRSLPTVFALYQNTPNPFNPTTRIEYALPKESMVSLKVYNLLGQEVATLVNEFQGAGYHRVNFNAVNLTTGLYLYRLEARDFTAIKKMMLVK